VLLEQMFRLRYQVFHQQLDWDVGGTGGMERDTFDDLDLVYVIAVHRRSGIAVGCARLLPTTGPHMLHDVAAFAPALHGRPPIRSARVWEISRLAVAPWSSRSATAGFSAVPRAVLAATGRYAATCGVTRFVTLSSVAVERRANASGIPALLWGHGIRSRSAPYRAPPTASPSSPSRLSPTRALIPCAARLDRGAGHAGKEPTCHLQGEPPIDRACGPAPRIVRRFRLGRPWVD
jgi:acyl homoserine lactone synthase